MQKGRSPQPMKADIEEAGDRWLWVLLAVRRLTLALQLVPTVWWALVSIFDIRSWTWREYAAICAVAIVALVAVGAW